MQFRILATGSSGNCFVIRHGDTLVALDCGLSPKAFARALDEDNLGPEDLDAILLTHEHSDHAGELKAMARATDCPIFLTAGTWQALRCPDLRTRRCFDSMSNDSSFHIGELKAIATPVMHDAREPVAWTFLARQRKLGVLTDTGEISPMLEKAFEHCNLLALEFNHDLDMLQRGNYPARLKKRIGSDSGHLNNEQAARFAGNGSLVDGARLIAVHVSENNNDPELIKSCLSQRLPESIAATIMPQRSTSAWLEV